MFGGSSTAGRADAARRMLGKLLTGLVLASALLTAGGAGTAAASPGASGPDAQPANGCPSASPSQASAATPGTPTRVRAITGNGSVTVSWCPPTRGQANVVSYTVTSSSGQQTTAPVPNAWAIVDGLSNATSYSFTVRANTKSGSGPTSRPSNAATPDPIAPPRDVRLGQPAKVTFDQ
ncbi:MAG: fibronectin type III domain-containing protein, partial [Solirubrobacterales bacterium]|nr:fibronectin type III domain-containing protein [Solirubrobacterales bacterium]